MCGKKFEDWVRATFCLRKLAGKWLVTHQHISMPTKIASVARYGEAGPGPKGTVMIVTFQLDGQKFTALNGGPQFTFSPAISFLVNCETQEEVDELWQKPSEGGEKNRCGWLQDKFGVSWQIVPTVLGEMMQDKDAEKSKRVMGAMLQMDKIDIATLKQAYEQQ